MAGTAPLPRAFRRDFLESTGLCLPDAPRRPPSLPHRTAETAGSRPLLGSQPWPVHPRPLPRESPEPAASGSPTSPALSVRLVPPAPPPRLRAARARGTLGIVVQERKARRPANPGLYSGRTSEGTSDPEPAAQTETNARPPGTTLALDALEARNQRDPGAPGVEL